jgi:hypothetical protein
MVGLYLKVRKVEIARTGVVLVRWWVECRFIILPDFRKAAFDCARFFDPKEASRVFMRIRTPIKGRLLNDLNAGDPCPPHQ